MKKIVTLLGMTVAHACTGAAFAHPEHDDAPVAALKKLEAKKNANGATIYVTNAGEVVPTAGATGTLTLLSGSKNRSSSCNRAGRTHWKRARLQRSRRAARHRPTSPSLIRAPPVRN